MSSSTFCCFTIRWLGKKRFPSAYHCFLPLADFHLVNVPHYTPSALTALRQDRRLSWRSFVIKHPPGEVTWSATSTSIFTLFRHARVLNVVSRAGVVWKSQYHQYFEPLHAFGGTALLVSTQFRNWIGGYRLGGALASVEDTRIWSSAGIAE